MNVEILTIGDELLLGFTVDTNAAFLGRRLAAMGVAVVRRTTCGDDRDAIVQSIREALERADAVITTGGLGPTADDMTTSAVAAAFDLELIRDDEIAKHLEQRWKSFGLGAMPESNYTQAMIPAGAEVLPNAHGSAPGVVVTNADGRWVATLPGVPREMRAMFDEALAPRIEARMQASADARAVSVSVIRSATVRTTGVAESALADRLTDVAGSLNGLSLAFLPSIEGVDLRLTSYGLSASETDHVLAAGVATLRQQLGDWVYGEGDIDLADVVIQACRSAELRIAVAESCTGGLLGARITAIAGSSDVFHGGVISYDNRVKRQLLGVLEDDINSVGAVSESVALQMAKGTRVRLGTEIGVGITGIAGPGGGTPEKPVGTVWIALDIAEGRPPLPRPEGEAPITPQRKARVFQLIGDRDEIRRRAAQAALNMIRRTVAELSNPSAP